MPTTLNKAFSIDWRGQPPHMLQSDVPVWYKFLGRYGHLFKKLYYDCLLGGIHLSPGEEEDIYLRMWRQNTAKRADAIAELEDAVWIIEVADYPGLRAIGQLQVYRSAWLRDPVIPKPERLILVSERIDEDLLDATAMHGIDVYLLPPDEGPRLGTGLQNK